jgi:hypothetical protein
MKKTPKDLETLINSFYNGVERFKNDPVFNQIVYWLASGGDPLQIIDQLVRSNNSLMKRLIDTETKSNKEGLVLYMDKNRELFPQPIQMSVDFGEEPDPMLCNEGQNMYNEGQITIEELNALKNGRGYNIDNVISDFSEELPSVIRMEQQMEGMSSLERKAYLRDIELDKNGGAPVCNLDDPEGCENCGS